MIPFCGGSKVDVDKFFLFYEIPIKVLVILDAH
jgi:hypothetical protein